MNLFLGKDTEDSRIPNHSRHTVGNKENTLPCASPSRALATHKFSIRFMIDATAWEIKKKKETRTNEKDRGISYLFFAKSETKPR